MDHATCPATLDSLLAHHILFPSSGLASWDRLFQAALEAEHSGILWEHRVVVILRCSHISISLSCCSLNGGRRLGVWLRHASLSSAFSSSPGTWLLHGTRPCHPCVAPEVHTASFECSAFPFPNILRMCRACCNRMCGCCCVSTLSSRTRFLFHRRGCASSFPISLTGPSSSVFFVEKVDSLPLFGIQSEIYLFLCRLNL